jgi:hypothetical protein
MSLRDLYQQHYFHENERRDQINNSIAIPLGIVSVVSSAFVVVAKEIDSPFDDSEKFQIFFLIITSIAIVSAVFFLIKAYWGYGYGHVPRGNELRKYRDELKAYYVGTGKPEDDARVISEEEALDYMDSQYASNAEKNAENNDIKSFNLFRANGFIFSSIVILVISAVPYVINSIQQPNEVQKFEITNLRELKMNATNNQQPQGQNQQPPVQPCKPTPPPSRVIKENVRPPVKK